MQNSIWGLTYGWSSADNADTVMKIVTYKICLDTKSEIGPAIPKNVLYMNLETTRLRGRPRNRWQDEVREDGRPVGGKGCKEGVYNRVEWKKLLRTARNCHILQVPME
jgi:hypothetical protein